MVVVEKTSSLEKAGVVIFFLSCPSLLSVVMASKRKEPGHTQAATGTPSPASEEKAKRSKMDAPTEELSNEEVLQRFLQRPFVTAVAGSADDPQEERQEVCYDHNYRLEGCLEGRRGRPCLPGQQGRCLFNHDNCHFCRKPGHTARSCDQFSIQEASRWFDFESRKPRSAEEAEAAETAKLGNVVGARGGDGSGHCERNDGQAFANARGLFEASALDRGSKPTAALTEYVC